MQETPIFDQLDARYNYDYLLGDESLAMQPPTIATLRKNLLAPIPIGEILGGVVQKVESRTVTATGVKIAKTAQTPAVKPVEVHPLFEMGT